MKKKLALSLISSITLLSLGAFSLGADCENLAGDFFCKEAEICNNPGGTCTCSSTSISHGQACTTPKYFQISSSQTNVFSGNNISFTITVTNPTATEQVLNVSTPSNSAWIQFTDATIGITNTSLMSLFPKQGPSFLIASGTTTTLTVKGQVQTPQRGFSTLPVQFTLGAPGKTMIASTGLDLFPKASLALSTSLSGSSIYFSGDVVGFLVSMQNQGSTGTDALRLYNQFPSTLGLGLPLSFLDGVAVSAGPIDPSHPGFSFWNVGTFAPGETKVFAIEAPLAKTLAVGTLFTNTSLFDTLSSVGTASVASFIDLAPVTITGIQTPQFSGDAVVFSLIYSNHGNTTTQGNTLIANISGTSFSGIVNLPDLGAESTGIVIITGMVNQQFSSGTPLCLNGIVHATNENTANTGNNTLAQTCISMGTVGDLSLTGNALDVLDETSKSGSVLRYQFVVSNKGDAAIQNAQVSITVPTLLQGVKTLWTGISLAAGAQQQIIITGTLGNFAPNQGWDLIVNAQASTTGKELLLGNNIATVSQHFSGLADLELTSSMAAFSGFKQGDALAVTLHYSNRGDRATSGTVLTVNLSGGLTTPQTVWNLGTLVPGQSGDIVLNPTLASYLVAGSKYTINSSITSSSTEVSTGNNTAMLSGTVPTLDGMSISLSAINQTRPILGSQGTSGDVMLLTISYNNTGNIPGTNASISIADLPVNYGSLFTSQTVGTITPDATGQISFQIRIPFTNFKSISPRAVLSYANGKTLSTTYTITEPLVCGDAMMTQNEQCDTASFSDPSGAQVCENQQGFCTLVTKYIVNTACIQYHGGIPGECSSARVDFQQAQCGGINLGNSRGNSSSSSIDVSCEARNANIDTPITLDCGNGTVLSGFGSDLVNGLFTRTCSYTGAIKPISCRVGTDTNNPVCRSNLANSCEIDTDQSLALVSEDEDGEVTATCSVSDGKTASIHMDCGNGKSFDGDGTSLERTCRYDEGDIGDAKTISCYINSSSSSVPSCSTDIIVDRPTLGYCGNGIREGVEQCDAGGKNGQGTKNGEICNEGCTNGKAPVCMLVNNGNISIDQGEVLPFRWRLEQNENFVKGDSCDNQDKGAIPIDTLTCEFKILRGDDEHEEEVYTVTKEKCLSEGANAWRNQPLITSWFPKNWAERRTNYYVGGYFTNFLTKDVNISENTMRDLSKENTNAKYGEYKIRLNKVDYSYCDGKDNEKTASSLNVVCESNFTVTQPYLVQKSAFGLTPKTTNIPTLDSFYDMLGNPLVQSTDLADIMLVNGSDYDAGSNRGTAQLENFASKYSKLTTLTKSSLPQQLQQASNVKKAPGKNIYVIEGNGGDITLNGSISSTPATLIINNMNLHIKGNVDVNSMFIVKGGNIIFESNDCDTQQIVKGIFVAIDGNISSNAIHNTDLSKQWCNGGGLYVKGVLMGNGLDALTNARRSQLNHWFLVNSSSENAIKAERRNEIFNGASVLIEYSPSLWSQLPPGADEFTKILEVYKK